MLPQVILLATALALPAGVDPALFPGLANRPAAEVELAGLSVLYPGRILRTPPRASESGNLGRSPLVAELPRGYTYLRIYDLNAALPKLTELLTRPALILDLRYVAADAPTAVAFATALARAGLVADPVKSTGNLTPSAPLPVAGAQLHPAGSPPVIALVNNHTAGPLEAWLAAFQATENLLIVGTPTAGQPGIYRPAEAATGYYVLAGELQPASGSLVGTGLMPRFPVDVTPEQTYRAYFEVERSGDPASVLRHDRPVILVTQNLTQNSTAAPPANGAPAVVPANGSLAAPANPATEEAMDPTLQRAVDIVAALQLLGRMPASTPAPAGAPRPANAAPAPASPQSSRN